MSETKKLSIAERLAKAGVKAAESHTPVFLSSGSPILDHRLSGKYQGGGFLSGRIVEIFGPPSAGKTAITTNVMKSAQKQGGFGLFMDHENSFDEAHGERLGLSIAPEKFLRLKPSSFEESIDEASKICLMLRGMVFKDGKYQKVDDELIPFDSPLCVGFDSLPTMVPMSVMIDKKGEARETASQTMRDNMALAMATAAHLPKLAQLADRTNALVILLNQPRTGFNKQGVSVETTPGGSAPEFNASVRLRLTRSIDYSDKEKAKVGQTINCEVIKNKTYQPFQKCEWYYQFNDPKTGFGKFDIIDGVIEELKSLGILETAGAYIVWEGKKLYKSALINLIEENGLQAKLIGMLPC